MAVVAGGKPSCGAAERECDKLLGAGEEVEVAGVLMESHAPIRFCSRDKLRGS